MQTVAIIAKKIPEPVLLPLNLGSSSTQAAICSQLACVATRYAGLSCTPEDYREAHDAPKKRGRGGDIKKCWKMHAADLTACPQNTHVSNFFESGPWIGIFPFFFDSL